MTELIKCSIAGINYDKDLIECPHCGVTLISPDFTSYPHAVFQCGRCMHFFRGNGEVLSESEVEDLFPDIILPY
jgi:hypothetical protein